MCFPRTLLLTFCLLSVACDDEAAASSDSGPSRGPDAGDERDGSAAGPPDAARPPDAGAPAGGSRAGGSGGGPPDAGPTCEDVVAELAALSERTPCESATDCALVGNCDGLPWFGVPAQDEALGYTLARRAVEAGCETEADGWRPTAECVEERCVAKFHEDPETGEPDGVSCLNRGDGDGG